jgi:hypothetical protein
MHCGWNQGTSHIFPLAINSLWFSAVGSYCSGQPIGREVKHVHVWRNVLDQPFWLDPSDPPRRAAVMQVGVAADPIRPHSGVGRPASSPGLAGVDLGESDPSRTRAQLSDNTDVRSWLISALQSLPSGRPKCGSDRTASVPQRYRVRTPRGGHRGRLACSALGGRCLYLPPDLPTQLGGTRWHRGVSSRWVQSGKWRRS